LKLVRSLTKFLYLAVALAAIGFLSSSARANDLLAGGFTLSEPTQWNNTMLPAGDYTLRLVRTHSDSHLLMVLGSKQSISMLVYGPSLCRTCMTGPLNLSTRGDNPVVTSMDLAGLHMNFDTRMSDREREEQLARIRKQTQRPAEQVAVHSDQQN
jgi:hypothetical protein